MTPLDVTKLVAAKGFAPSEWQTPYPDHAWSHRIHVLPVRDTAELRRIVALPRRPELEPGSAQAEAMIELMTRRFAKPPAPCRCRAILQEHGRHLNRKCIVRLRLVQAQALYELGTVGGLLGPIGVGFGKTALDLLACMAMRDCRRAVLLVPPNLIDQLVVDYKLIGEHFRVPSIVIHGRGQPRGTTVPGAPQLHVLPYSRLSRPESTVFLEQLAPDFIIADEAHRLRHADTATVARVLRYRLGHPEMRFACWTGSFTDQAIEDYAHLAALSLGRGSPLPTEQSVIEEWSSALHYDEDKRGAPGALVMLASPGESVYAAFNRRLVETEGVVATEESAIDSELQILERTAPEIPAEVNEAMRGLRETWMRPDGEELVDAVMVTRCARELACGFYYVWRFTHGETDAQIRLWLERRKWWHRELRKKLFDRAEHLDSPLLCQHAAERGWGQRPQNPGLPVWKAETWPGWLEVRDTVQPISHPIWISDYLAQDAAAWAHATRGIVWYESSAFGRKVAEISGLTLHAGGPKAGEEIAKENGERSIIASIPSHGTGRDGLQYLFHEQLVAQPPPSAMRWEQLLGRLCRIGQESPIVRAWFYRHTPELRAHVDEAMARAAYVQSTLGADQKILTGWRAE